MFIPVRRVFLLNKIVFFFFASALLFASVPSHTAPLQLPEMGDPSAVVLSAEKERLLGQAFMRNIRRVVHVFDDPEINTYINSLGYKLLANTNTEQTNFTFFVIDQPNINAFAAPGGYIGFNSGLIIKAQSEGELAAVVAHEISHVTQHHLARAFEKASTANLQTAAAILAAILLSSKDPQMAQAALIAAMAGSIQRQLNFTRAHEKEADWLGIDILARSGYNPQHMAGFFYRLQEATRFADGSYPELLRTHPVTANRIADAQDRANRYASVQEKTQPSFDYVKAKLTALTLSKNDNYMAQLKQTVEKQNSPIVRYEYALALLLNRNTEKAQAINEALLKEQPEHINFIALQSQIEIAKAQFDDAEKRLNHALTLYPNHPWLTVLYAEVLMTNDKAHVAIPYIRSLIEEQGRFALPIYYKHLAQAQNNAGEIIEGYQSLAEYYYQIGQTRTAADQLKTALRTIDKKDSYNKERIEARLKVLEVEALEELADH